MTFDVIKFTPWKFDVSGVVNLAKAMPAVPLLADEELTPAGYDRVSDYARKWLAGTRDLSAETTTPELRPFFRDVRLDSEVAHHFGDPLYVVR